MSTGNAHDPAEATGPGDTTDTPDTTTTTSQETGTMSNDSTSAGPQFSDPLADPVPLPESGPDATTTIPASSTRALPTTSPFRVEPSAPVPDDVVTDATQLPHLPPPSLPDPSQPGAWPPPAGTAPSHHDPRPALVTVRKGPRPGSIMFGLLTMIVAGWLLAANLTDSDLTFRLVGPPMIGAFGGMLLVVGLAGVVAGRLRR